MGVQGHLTEEKVVHFYVCPRWHTAISSLTPRFIVVGTLWCLLSSCMDNGLRRSNRIMRKVLGRGGCVLLSCQSWVDGGVASTLYFRGR